MSDFNSELKSIFGESLGDYLFSVHDLLKKFFPATELDNWWRMLEPEIIGSLKKQGQAKYWESQISRLPDVYNTSISRDDAISIQSSILVPRSDVSRVSTILQNLKPWRKGPFNFFGIDVDSEWRSDMKWSRISPHLQPLRNTKILDVGCGNGYYMWRMLGQGASLVLGIDPSYLCLAQFRVAKRYEKVSPIALLPVGTETLGRQLQWFDVVFSMGVLYHRRDPVAHLSELRNMLKPGGQLVLETLVIDSQAEETLIPKNRYAQMRNVWGIQSPPLVIRLLRSVGFKNVSLVDITKTTIEEQRVTYWINSFSLENFLDLQDSTRTIEGYPAPIRACFVARA